MTIWLVEGLPGAGKSTLARHLGELASDAGHMARWYLEEDKDHPVHPATLRAQGSQGGVFAEACLDAWATFVSRDDQGVLHILEGSAFQSSVRFMLETGYAGIDDYFRRFEDILLPFAPPDDLSASDGLASALAPHRSDSR
jgi:hypothetical protein